MSEKNQDALALVQEQVNEMDQETAKAQLQRLLQIEAFSHFEAGALLHRCHEEWYAEKAQYEEFVHKELRIGLDKAARLRRTYLSVKAAQLTEADLQGITVSAIAVLRPVLEKPQYKEHVQVFLERARTLSVTALKDAVDAHLDRQPKGPKSPAERLGASLAAFINGVEGDNLDRAEQMLAVIEQTLPSVQIEGEIRDKETGETRVVSLNVDETEPQAEDAPKVVAEGEVESHPMLEYVDEVRQELAEARRQVSEAPSEAATEAVV